MENTILHNMKSIKSVAQTLPEQVAEQIRALIIEQQLGVGDKLPNEFELCTQLNVGRGTVREAVKLLVARNVLEIQRGRGTFIANNTGLVDDPFGFAYMDDEARLARELFEIRLHLEPWAAYLAAQNATEENLQEVVHWQKEVETLMLAGKNYLPADQQFHIAIAACTQNRVLPVLLPTITYSVHLFGKMNHVKLGQETLDTHRKIVECIRSKDPRGAHDAMADHLKLNLRTVPALAQNDGL